MEAALTPIKASRRLLAVLASRSTAEFEPVLRSDALLQICSDECRQIFLSRPTICQALLVEAAAWPDPTINIQGWDEDAETATVAFQIWVRENGLVTQHDHSLTITLRDDQIEKITLYRNQKAVCGPIA
jgi:hypothetical protein